MTASWYKYIGNMLGTPMSPGAGNGEPENGECKEEPKEGEAVMEKEPRVDLAEKGKCLEQC